MQSPYLYNELVQNSLMSSPKGDPFWSHAFKVLVSEYTKPVLSATGPVFLDTTVKTNKEIYHKLPCENFQRIPMGEHEQSPFLTLLHREILGRLFRKFFVVSLFLVRCNCFYVYHQLTKCH